MILGWDIGGVNTKVARRDDNGALTVRSRPFELQREPGALVRVLRDLAAEVGVRTVESGSSRMTELTCAVTMTAELSQMFRIKREGVEFVLDAVSAAFPEAAIRVFTTDGRFLTIDAARNQPIAVAAANWAATARLVASRHPDAVLVDVGTTTTDIIPIVNGRVVAEGKTDPERLATGELVYSGVLRTPVEAIVHDVRHRGETLGVSAEGFALIGDVHVWLGRLEPADYTVPTPDGRPAAREFGGARIARVICADRELLDDAEITHIADWVAARQVATIAAAIRRVRSRQPALRTAVVTGLGDFIARAAARSVSLDVVSLADDIGEDAARYAPAAAVALLCADGPAEAGQYSRRSVRLQADQSLMVIKVGGGLLEHLDHLGRVVAAISDVSRTLRVVVVPGGGPFADAVRRVDERLPLGDEEAHWMAILGMDQYAHLLAARIDAGAVVAGREEIEDAHRRGHTPVLAPSAWLKAADPLSHSWDVTSDSIAAWVAGELGAARLLLIKPPGARGPNLVDAHFENARPAGCACDCLAADEAIDRLSRASGHDAAHALDSR
ncbi:MAG TPA: hydantoinase/oxoprolinase family protein [Vicinamibacterales bacterium]|nr:hydantoinase/oxoprolinase family protein [Vicinamibacterales bacterium]